VLPGEYTVKLLARGHEVTGTVQVRADPRVPTSADALRARMVAGMRIGELNHTNRDGAKLLEALDAELARIRKSVEGRAPLPAGADSAIRDVATRLDSLRPKFRPGFASPMGRALDLLGALEASSNAPTEAQQRTLDFAAAELREDLASLDDLRTTRMPALRAKLGELAPGGGPPVRPPGG
jgi:hypothetical protein